MKFVCEFCGKKFKSKAGLRAHERIKHGVWVTNIFDKFEEEKE